MKYGDHLSAISLTLLGLFLMVKGFGLGLMFRSSIGPGFFPFIVGILLCLFSLTLLVQTLMRKSRDAERHFWQTVSGRRQVLLTLAGIIAYAFSLNTIGFLPATILLLLFLFRCTANFKWWVTVLGAVGSSVIAYLIFEVWLKANLPPGMMTF